ncbi:hypothetical protein, partial [Citrobacter sp.]|uniref:hypothetical protein n=1 Tax=Citrobacter sp. TaxID=1896336 RepID=UPI002FCBDC13
MIPKPDKTPLRHIRPGEALPFNKTAIKLSIHQETRLFCNHFSPIHNDHCVFYFLTRNSLAPSSALRHFLYQANIKSITQQVNGEGYVFYFW